MKRLFLKLRSAIVERHPLEVKMSVWVAMAVTVVTVIVVGIASQIYYKSYEDDLREGIEKDINISTENISLVMGYIEKQMHASVEYANEDARNREYLDSILVETLRGFNDVDAVTIIYRAGFFKGKKGHFERTAYFSNDNKLKIVSSKFDPTDDANWRESFINRRFFWCNPYKASMEDAHMICLSAPLLDDDGKPYAVMCASLQIKRIIPVVEKYKTNQGIDISVYAKDGQCIVPQRDDIAAMSEDDLIIEEREIEDLGWRLVFSTPKEMIDRKVNKALFVIILFALLLLVAAVMAIILSVIYVARPFIRTQEELAESKAAMQKEMDIASKTQQSIVPHTFPPFPNRTDIDLFASLEPALEVGGDLYDYFIHEDTLHFCIGDVSGKGMPASLFMSAARYLFRSRAEDGTDINKAVENINRSLCTDNVNCTFITFFYGCLNLKTGVLRYCNAGHNLPILHHAADGTTDFINNADDGMPLGVFEEAEYEVCTLQMDCEDMLFLYTDGVTEAMNEEHHELGDDATLSCVSSNADSAAPEVVAAVRECIRRHAGMAMQSDDITMLCIRRKSQG